MTSPTSPASRGAEAIPAQRERRSRRAYHPRSGKMRADLPPAASGGQGIRHATGTPATTRTGEYGVVGGVEGLAPLTPCRSPRRRPSPDAGQYPQSSGEKEGKMPLAPYDPQPRVGAIIPEGQHGYARRTIGFLPAARQRAFGLPLSRARAGRASVRRRSFRPCGAAISSTPCLAYAGKPPAAPSFPSGDSPPRTPGKAAFLLMIPCTVPEKR